MNPNDLRNFTNRNRRLDTPKSNIPQEFLDRLGNYGPDPKGIDFVFSRMASAHPDTMLVMEMVRVAVNDCFEAGEEAERNGEETLYTARSHAEFDAYCQDYPLLVAFLTGEFLGGIGNTMSLTDRMTSVVAANMDRDLLQTMKEEFNSMVQEDKDAATSYTDAMKRMSTDNKDRTRTIMRLMDGHVMVVATHLILTVLGVCENWAEIEREAAKSILRATHVVERRVMDFDEEE